MDEPTGLVVGLIREAGWPAYLELLLGAAAITASLLALAVALVKAEGARWVAGLSLLGTAVTLASGLAGMEFGRRKVEAVLLFVSPVERDVILHQGFKETVACVIIAMAMAALPTLLGLVASGVSLQRAGSGLVGVLVGGAALAGCWALSVYCYLQPLPGRELTSAQREVLHIGEALKANKPHACEPLARLAPEAAVEVQSLGEWRGVQTDCVERALSSPAGEEREAVQNCPLLDPDLRARLGRAAPPPAPPAPPPTPAEPASPLQAVKADVAEPPSEAVVGSDAIDPAAFRRVIAQSRGRVRACYERGLKTNPSLAGKVVVELSVEPTGRVSSAKATEASTLPDPAVRSCVASALQSLIFPAHAGGPVRLTYPFTFSSAN